MLEWMHDSFVVEKLQTDFMSKTIEDCNAFIKNSQTETDCHWAIVDDCDKYMGTVSLKHITEETAEFAITVCREAMGKGYSIWAMREALRMGFEKYCLKDIYWCVAKDNVRALRFYDKNHFLKISSDMVRIAGGYTAEQISSYVWYQISNQEEPDDND